MGQTFVGKSTLLNAMVNFAVGIRISNKQRFQIVIDPAENCKDQTKSQTSEITRYRIKDHDLGYNLEIWDTPGFGDTRGIKHDHLIRNQITQLINQEESCHAICFVVRAGENRLTPTQQYIINSVLSFFSEEAKANIYAFITYADVLTNISCFFKHVSNQMGFCLNNSKSVIKMRCRLTEQVPILYEKIADSAIKPKQLATKYSELKEHQDWIEKTGRFEHLVEKQKEGWEYYYIFFHVKY